MEENSPKEEKEESVNAFVALWQRSEIPVRHFRLLSYWSLS